MPGDLEPSVMSEAVTVELPSELSAMLKFLVPEASAALDGNVALVSEDVMPTVCVTFVTTFQRLSTALTVTLKETPAG